MVNNKKFKYKPVSAPRGTKLSCASWQTEAPMRMLLNNLDPAVAEDPESLIVYGGSGKAARSWECVHKIIACLKKLEDNQTLMVQSGKPVGIFQTHKLAPRVLIANSNLVPLWANWDKFRELEGLGLIMYGQMTAGSWIYIGTQGILQGTYETFLAASKKHFSGSLNGRFVLSAGLGGMGGAQPLAATMNGAAFLGVDVDANRIRRRVETGYCDMMCDSLDEAISIITASKKNKKAVSIGLVGNAADVFPELVRKGIIPDVVTDQTSAHDELNGYVPNGLSLSEAVNLRNSNPSKYIQESYRAMSEHCSAIIEMQRRGAVAFDYGNNLRGQALKAGVSNAFDYPGFVPAYVRPLFCEGKGPFRWVALSGDPEDIYVTDEAVLKAFPKNQGLKKWITLAQEKVQFQGLPSRICWLGYGERAKIGLIFNDLVRKKKVKAPIVIGRDHLDCGSVASPNRETEGMKDGSDAIADWPLLNAMLNTASGATWVSIHHGGGVGIGYSIHAGVVVVADGTKLSDQRLELVLTNDPATGVMRHADAGYDIAVKTAKSKKIRIPFLKG